MHDYTIQSKINLNNGLKMPRFGFGTFKAKSGQEAKEATYFALKAGYVHIDTAKIYGNEVDVGQGIQQAIVIIG